MQAEFNRRHFLQAGAATLALPALESFAAPTESTEDRPKNFVAIGTYLGWYQYAFYPQQAGTDGMKGTNGNGQVIRF